MFICTANDVQQISGPLRDRLEIIELDGYTLKEKVVIAERHLLGRAAVDCGLPCAPAIDTPTLERLVDGYTREAGVRELTRKLGALFRNRAVARLEAAEQQATDSSGGVADSTPVVNAAPAGTSPLRWDEVLEVLGAPRHRPRERPEVLPVGVATGLSVSGSGGSTLYVEVGCMPGKGELRSTGRLGEVMRESVHAALTHIKMDPRRYGIEERRLSDDLHVHLPEAAIAKEGPSAGIAVFAALLSALREQALPADLAMTGELTLTGDVLPVGGVRAKLLAAERAGIRRVLIPSDNRADVPKDVIVEVIPVRHLSHAVPYLLGSAHSTPTVQQSGPQATDAA